MSHFDCIIVGHGLAGSVLALTLVRENKKVLIVDDPALSSSSKVAAGLYQPMTFKRTVETWKGLESIVFSTQFYQWAEEFLQSEFFHPLPMFRLFSSFEEQNNWSLKSGDSYFSKLIGEENNSDSDGCHRPFGYGRVFHSGYLDIPQLLYSSCSYFKSAGSFLTEKINYNELKFSESKIIYKSFTADKIIFCEGWLIKDNPWFSYIPMKPVKGEVLTIELKNKKMKAIISGGLFAVPGKEGDFKIGSNYNWNDLNEIPTGEIKEEFSKKISEMVKDEINVTNHLAGIRPASHDRRPFIGSHPNNRNMYVFNGLGARGVALAPFTASILKAYINDEINIPNEISAERFTRYFKG